VSSLTKRALAVAIAFAALGAGIGAYVAVYLTAAPPPLAAAQTPAGVQLYVATVPAAGPLASHPTWVSYYRVDAQSHHWRHTTTWVVPAHALVHVTIYQYDSSTGLRNPFLSEVAGTVGGVMMLNGKAVRAVSPDAPAHTFAIPQLGVSVPLPGVSDNAKNPCGQAPCSLSNAHETISFTFRAPGRGLYRWQCFVPCAAGFIQGNGGPMQTIGYMGGFIKVV